MIFIDPHTDLLNVLQFINDFSKEIGIRALNVDTRRIEGIINGAVFDGDYASSQASPFKKLAAFVSYFVVQKPIISPLPLEKFRNIENHQNAIFAFEIAIDSLHGAKIHRSDGDFILENKIELSEHSYIDVIDAIAYVTPQYGKKLVAVLLEQMCYRKNSACEYFL